MHNKIPVVILACLALTTTPGCKKDSELSPFNEGSGLVTLGISPVPAEPAGHDSTDTISMLYDLGARGQFASFNWSDLEPTVGAYNLSDLSGALQFLGNQHRFGILLGLNPVYKYVKTTPSDLMNVSFDSPVMQTRFRALIDTLATRTNGYVYYISLGNEADIYCSAHPDEWAAYKVFFEDAVRYIHAKLPTIRVGVSVTFNGAVNQDAGNVLLMTSLSDVCIFTYYPFTREYGLRDPSSPTVDFPAMMNLGGGRLVVLQEAGYPSSELLGSSQQKQAEFVSYVFGAWLSVGRQMQFINFFALHDYSLAAADSFLQHTGTPDTSASLKAFALSLGLRTVSGAPKLSWQVMTESARNYIR